MVRRFFQSLWIAFLASATIICAIQWVLLLAQGDSPAWQLLVAAALGLIFAFTAPESEPKQD